MAKTYVYMNHRIRDPRPRGPVVAVSRNGRTRHANTVILKHKGKVIGGVLFRANGLGAYAAPTHVPRGWMWLEEGVKVEMVRRSPKRRTAQKETTMAARRKKGGGGKRR